MQKFGKWLYNNNQVSFGKNVDEEDYIFEVSYEGMNFKLESIRRNGGNNFNYYDDSCFKNDFYHSTDQKLIIPSKSNLLGFSPFFIKLDHKFIKNNKTDQKAIEKFYKKIERSLNANSNNKEFTNIVELYFDDFEEKYLNQIPFPENQKRNFLDFYNKISKEDFKSLIIDYYSFLFENYNEIINEINKFKESDKYTNKKSNFYLACIFGDLKDLCNDFFYYYSTFLQSTSQKVNDYEMGICSICGNNKITYPPLPYYNVDSISSFNYSPDMENSKLRICKNCSTFIKYSEDKLSRIINVPSILIIPKNKSNLDYGTFLKIANKDINTFEKINLFLKECDDYNFDLLIINDDKSKGIRRIKKYIENYKAFLVKFEDLYLYDNNNMNYLFNEPLPAENISKSNINNTFDLENIFKEYFWELDDSGLKFPNLYYFYEIHIKDLTGQQGIFNNFSSKTVSLFSKYCDNIFSLIYEINLDNLNKLMLNEIVLNSIEIFQKASFGDKSYKWQILRRLNSYFMFKKEFLGDNMLKNENVIKIKQLFSNHDSKGNIILENDDKQVVKDLIKDDVALKYYLLGQFISLIDIYKSKNGKNKQVFSNFITNVNRNNIRKLFVSEILQKNNFYIEKMNKKGKFLFEIFESSVSELFNEESNFNYEDYLLLMFTGYYTDNILLSKYEFLEE